MRQIILSILNFLLFAGCSNHTKSLTTVDEVNLNRYLGTWYEIARFEHWFEKGCSNVTANYSLKDNGDIKVINKCMKEDNQYKESIGTAYTTDKTNSKLKVSFFKPFYGDYWILDLDENYQYALIGDPSRKYMWILARDSKIDNTTKNKVLNKASSLDFDISKLHWTVQEY
ncbi:lipocalin family protein [Candidatus Sulfurimonas baltica]|uniref:Lipocalin family protein n=1 Tax=Candidatus Sulfurimonas baltica TaxID=2740404 RepID=A0A7S7LW18_9BACT|nr:lipocalin family protein [Candidatus Sulfurimonas baltica]QOY52508.1 lipocalin family protein [Candidatus Sulfurimonas baltica]